MTPDQPNDPQPAEKPQSPPSEARRRHPAFSKERRTFREDKPPALDEREVPTSGVRLRELDRMIEDEMAAALGELSEADLMGQEQRGARSEPASSGPLKGPVISIHGGDIFVEVPGKRIPGVISVQQFEEGRPAIGSEVEFTIEGYDKANGLLLLSRRGALAVDVDWSTVSEGMVVEGRVTETNKGGLTVEVNGIRGFMPISQIELFRVEDLDQYVNQKLKGLVTEANPEERNLVVSRRALLEKERELERERLLSELEEGQTRTGTVRNVKPFGVFVDLGGVDGMVPVSEMSWARVRDPSDLVSIGQKVQVKVLRIDPDTRKISLSLRQLEASPWDNINDKYFIGQTLTGKVTRTADYGAFVELEPGVEGLIHISEISTQRVHRVRDAVKEDQEVTVQVVSVDATQRRIGLSMKAAELAARKVEDAKLVADSEGKAEGSGDVAGAEPPPAVEPPKLKKLGHIKLRGGLGGSPDAEPPA